MSEEKESFRDKMFLNSRLSETAILNNSEFFQQKRFKLVTKKVKRFFVLIIFISLSCYSYIKIRFSTIEMRPFNFCFLSNSLLTILIPISFIKNVILKKWKQYNFVYEREKTEGEMLLKLEQLSDIIDKNSPEKNNRYYQDFYIITFPLMILWTSSTVCLYYGISLSSHLTVNALANTSVILILLGKYIILKNKVSLVKILSSLVFLAGLSILTIFKYNSANAQKEKMYHFPLVGSILTVMSSIFFSAYALLLKYYSKKYKHFFDVMEIFGYIGLFNLLGMPFVLVIFKMMFAEYFHFPSLEEVVKFFGKVFIVGILCDQLQSYAISYVSPVVVAFGLGTVIPFLYGMDILIASTISFNSWYAIGSLFMIISFAVVLSEHIQNSLKKKTIQITKKISKEGLSN